MLPIDYLFEDAFKYSILSKFKTNNIFLDTVISTFLLSILGLILKTFYKPAVLPNTHLWIDIVKSWFYKKHVITIEGKRTTSYSVYARNPVISLVFSNRFKAIWHHLLETMEKNSTIYEIKEICNITTNTADGSRLNDDYDDDLTRETHATDDQDLYVVSQKRPFVLDADLQIYAQTQLAYDNDADVNEPEKRGSSASNHKSERMTIILYSYHTDLKKIRDYVDKIAQKYVFHLEEARRAKQFIYTLSSTEYNDNVQECWTEHQFNSSRRFANMFFDGKAEILDKIQFFLDNRSWYYEMGIPYTLGIGLHGPPGTGKTSFIKALANMTGRHIVVLSLQMIKTRKQLHDFWDETRYNLTNKKGKIDFSKKIMVIEDIDCAGEIVLKRRKNGQDETDGSNSSDISSIDTTIDLGKQRIETHILEKLDQLEKLGNQVQGNEKDIHKHLGQKWVSSSLNDTDNIHLDDLLNIIDGIKEAPGRILIISSNHYDKLDDALTRPGRIDLTIKMDNASRRTIAEMYRHFYQADLASNVVDAIKDRVFSPAQVINQYILHKDDPDAFIQGVTNIGEPSNGKNPDRNTYKKAKHILGTI